MLTPRQKQILDFITKYNKRYGVSPALEEIKRHFRLKSVSGIHQHIESLKNKGYLNKAENQPRGIEIRKTSNQELVQVVQSSAADGMFTATGLLTTSTYDLKAIRSPYTTITFATGTGVTAGGNSGGRDALMS